MNRFKKSEGFFLLTYENNRTWKSKTLWNRFWRGNRAMCFSGKRKTSSIPPRRQWSSSNCRVPDNSPLNRSSLSRLRITHAECVFSGDSITTHCQSCVIVVIARHRRNVRLMRLFGLFVIAGDSCWDARVRAKNKIKITREKKSTRFIEKQIESSTCDGHRFTSTRLNDRKSVWNQYDILRT